MSDERRNSIIAANYKITPELSCYGTKTRVEFYGSCLKQDKVTYNHGKKVNIYIALSKNYNISSYSTLENCLLGAVSLTKNDDIDQYKYSEYGIGFDRKAEFSFGSRGFDPNCIILGADMSSSSHPNNKKKILFLSFVNILYKE